jgi:hypothetical protein
MVENKKHPMCLKTLSEICESLGESIDSPLCKEVQSHLEQCPQCCAFVDSIKKTIHLYRGYINEKVPHDIDEHLWKRLDLQKPD